MLLGVLAMLIVVVLIVMVLLIVALIMVLIVRARRDPEAPGLRPNPWSTRTFLRGARSADRPAGLATAAGGRRPVAVRDDRRSTHLQGRDAPK